MIKVTICLYIFEFCFYRDNLLKTSASHHPGKPLSGMKILDVGCGGGLLTEVSALLCLYTLHGHESGLGGLRVPVKVTKFLKSSQQ